MAVSGDYDLDNLTESIKKIFNNSDMKNIEIDVENRTFYLNGDFSCEINWDNKKAIDAALHAIKV